MTLNIVCWQVFEFGRRKTVTQQVVRASTFGNFRKTLLPSTLQQHRFRSLSAHPSNFRCSISLVGAFTGTCL